MTRLTIQGREVPADLVGEMTDADQAGDLAAQLADRGYLLLRGIHKRDDVLAARREVMTRLAEVDEIAPPPEDGIATGRSRRAELHPDLAAFWQSVSEGPALRRLINAPPVTRAMDELFGEPSSHFSFAWLRAMTAGRASPMHVDHPYMNRGSARLVTSWTPLGTVGRDEGPIYVVEGSHRWRELRERFEGHDAPPRSVASWTLERAPHRLCPPSMGPGF